MVGRLTRLARTVKNHPKKSLLFSSLLAYGGKRYYDNHVENELIAVYCQEAVKYGNQKILPNEKLRHITVMINPAAANGKAKQKFNQYCAPLLHLAGILVSTVQLEHEGQAKEYMEIMKKSDGLVVVGGDGTLSEVITGLMRREDRKEAIEMLPLSVLPLGESSYSGKAINRITGTVQPKDLMDATMAVIHNNTKFIDVVEVRPQPRMKSIPNTEEHKPVYMVGQLQWGAFRDAWERRNKYWYFGPFRAYASYVFSSYNENLNWNCKSIISRNFKCETCEPKPSLKLSSTAAETSSRGWMDSIWTLLFGSKKSTDTSSQKLETPEVETKKCTSHPIPKLTCIDNASEIKITTDLFRRRYDRVISPSELKVQSTPQQSALSFIEEGWNRLFHSENNPAKDKYIVKHDQELTLVPHLDEWEHPNNEEKEFSIDGESYPLRPVVLKVVPEAIKIFKISPPAPVT